MKKTIITIAAIACFSLAQADNEKTITVTELPQKAQKFLAEHFAKRNIVKITVEQDNNKTKYEVEFKNGDEISFGEKGKWRSIDCEKSSVPKAIFNDEICKELKQKYPKIKILEVKNKNKHFEIEFEDGTEIKIEHKNKNKASK